MTPVEEQEQKLKEQGLPAGEPPPQPASAQWPAGMGQYAVAAYEQFSATFNSVTRTYRYTFDEALRASPTNALAMRRDPVLMDALRARQIPTAQLTWRLEPQDESDESQQQAVQVLTKIIERIPHFQRFRMHLLEAIWYGRYGVQIDYGWDYRIDGQRRMVVKDYHPVNGDKLAFRYSGDVGLLVGSAYSGPTEAWDRGRVHFLSVAEREQFVVHKFEPESSDFFEPELAGAYHGVGVRGRLYWFWFLRSNVFAQMMTYLERSATGFTIYWYDGSNPQAMEAMRTIAQAQAGNNTILLPRWPKTGEPDSVTRLEPGLAGAQILESLSTNYFDNVMRQYILGQTLTTTTASTGLGSGVANAHETTFSRIVEYDAVALAETLTEDLVAVLSRYNCPGVPPPRFKFDIDNPNVGEYSQAAQLAFEMGLDLDADDFRAAMGLPKPQPGHAVLSKFGAMQPSAVAAAPEGVPFAGPPGPAGPVADPNVAAQGQPNGLNAQQYARLMASRRRYLRRR